MPKKIILKDDQNQNVLEEDLGLEIQRTKDFGCGLDCHSRFVQVSVFVKVELSIYEYRKQFDTDWNSITKAKEWVVSIIREKSYPHIDPVTNFHYTLESTSNYHQVVIRNWGGHPSIVNPTLARAGRKKTDILDAKSLAMADITGIWPESYIPNNDVIELRMLISEKEHFSQLATMISNRMNNSLLALGITIGRDGSVSKNAAIRDKVQSLISGENVSSNGDSDSTPSIPEDVRCIFEKDYEEYDSYCKQIDEYQKKIISKIESMRWETANDTISGSEALKILTSVPGVGIQTAILWLSRIVTPRRFSNEKALAAYCGCDPSLKVSAGKVTSTVKRGGRKDLHSALCSAASNLMRHHSEPFGRFGYNIAMQSGVWKKGVSALARKMSVAMYFMLLRNEPFSYEKYKMVSVPEVIDIPVETLAAINPAFKRYLRYLIQNDITTTKILVYKYSMCSLPTIKGLGKNFFALVKDFIEHQETYNQLLERYTNEKRQK